MNNKHKINKYLYKLINTNNLNKNNIYEKKYIQYSQTGGNKDLTCSNKKFKNSEIIKEIYFLNLLTKLHTLILSSENTPELNSYKSQFELVINLILDILNKIKINSEYNIEPLSLISYYHKNKKFPPIIINYFHDKPSNEKKILIEEINKYQDTILNIKKIGYIICSLIYDNLITKPQPINTTNAKLLSHVLQETIKYFDNDIETKKNFMLFHETFSFMFKKIATKLNTKYLDRNNLKDNVKKIPGMEQHLCYLILVKYKNKISFIKDTSLKDIDKINKILYNFEINNNTELHEINTKISEYQNKISDLTDLIYANNYEIEKIEENLNYKHKEKELLEARNDVLKADISLYNELIHSNTEKLNYIISEFLSINNTRLTLTDEEYDNYINELINSVKNNINVLVPILLFEITQENTEINNISNYIVNQQNLSYKLKLHSNMLFINNEKKYIEHFEPHGVSGLYDSTKVFNILESLHKKIREFENYTYIKQVESCPILQGPQALDRTEYCFIHSSYYSLLRILYPNITSEELQMMLISKLNPNFIDNQETNVSLEYLNNKYIPLNGYEIKTRLENFMRWYRSIIVIVEMGHIDEYDQLRDIVKSILQKEILHEIIN